MGDYVIMNGESHRNGGCVLMSWLTRPLFWILVLLVGWVVLVTVLIALGLGGAPGGGGAPGSGD
jgi:hypothetical protein